ncbi:DUF4097 family beta strand repeat-containing protein [Niallia sp. 01092]|uniref:DUF4097 family beta strand repeat-containing protein n=1 Tax=unclassified Niallia TaxID=2837522 RepID=UPI003FCF4856
MADEKKRILQLLESGKLTVDEALALIEKVDQSDFAHSSAVDEKETVNELATEVKFQEKKKETFKETPSFNFQSAKEKIFGFVDSTIKKVKDVDLDLNFGHYEEVSHIFQYTDLAPENIDIDIPNGEVELIPWDNQEIRVECKAKVYRVENYEEAKQTFLKEVDISADQEKLELKVHHKWMKLYTNVYIPKSAYKTVKVRLFNGPIKTFDLVADQVYTKTANGKITIVAGRINKVEADAANGSIEMEKSIVEELDAETINGAIKVEGHFNKVDVQSFNGNLVCTNHSKECEYLDLKGTTGSIEVNISDELAVNGSLKTNFGGFNVELEGIQIIEEKNEVLQKTLQFQSIQSKPQRTIIDANTKTGSIKIQKIVQQS